MQNTLSPLVIGDLEIKIPIIQGGMGVRVSTSSLASAVAGCGGAGIIASVGLGSLLNEQSDYITVSQEALKQEIRKARKLTKGVIGVNILSALSNYEDLVRTASSEQVDIIISGAGLPLKLPQYVDNQEVKLIPIVSSPRSADLIIRTWKKRYNRLPDAFVIEGPLAGGHLGFKSDDLASGRAADLRDIFLETLKVVGEYEKSYKKEIPLIVAGGIFDGRDIAAFLKLGAKGVQMATRFVSTFECAVPDEFKKLYTDSVEDDIIFIESPVGLPGRAIKTTFTDKLEKNERIPFRCNYKCLKTCDPSTAPYCIALALLNAVSGNLDDAVVFAGSNVARIKDIISVEELMDELVNETLEELNKQKVLIEHF